MDLKRNPTAWSASKKTEKNVPIAVFDTSREALVIIPSLNERYRLLLGDRLVWPNEASAKSSPK